jgi:hypothetical protein
VRAIQALCGLLEARELIARSDLVARFGESAIRALEGGRLAGPGPSLSVVRCQLCDAGHLAAVHRRGDGFGYHCVTEGCEGVVPPDTLATLMVEPAMIVARLRWSIGRWRGDFPARPLIPHRLWRLGEGQLADNRTWTCFLALQAIDGAIIEAVEQDTGPQGLVIAAAASPLFAKIASHRIVGLADIADVDQTGAMLLEARAIESALGMRAMAARKAGRKAKGQDEAVMLVRQLPDDALLMPIPEILAELRRLGAPFSAWGEHEPPATLEAAVTVVVEQERHQRGLTG